MSQIDKICTTEGELHHWQHSAGEVKNPCFNCRFYPGLETRSKCYNCAKEICVYCLYELFNIDRTIIAKRKEDLTFQEQELVKQLLNQGEDNEASTSLSLPNLNIQRLENFEERNLIIEGRTLDSERRLRVLEQRVTDLHLILEDLRISVLILPLLQEQLKELQQKLGDM